MNLPCQSRSYSYSGSGRLTDRNICSSKATSLKTVILEMIDGSQPNREAVSCTILKYVERPEALETIINVMARAIYYSQSSDKDYIPKVAGALGADTLVKAVFGINEEKNPEYVINGKDLKRLLGGAGEVAIWTADEVAVAATAYSACKYYGMTLRSFMEAMTSVAYWTRSPEAVTESARTALQYDKKTARKFSRGIAEIANWMHNPRVVIEVARAASHYDKMELIKFMRKTLKATRKTKNAVAIVNFCKSYA